MVIAKLLGGLGNQMFQYASARGIAGNNRHVALDKSFFNSYKKSSPSFTARPYELNSFSNLKAKPLNVLQEYALNKDNTISAILKKMMFSKFRFFQQKQNEYIEGLNNVDGTLYLYGYFQSEKYFRHLRENLLHEFSFGALDSENLHFLNKIKSYKHSVSIHVRRGDYLKPEILNYHGILPLSYYATAIKLLNKEVSEPHFFIFSDDSEWCKDNFTLSDGTITIVDSNNSNCSWKDMCLMSHCKHHIIANSSFSWWGAWLSQLEGLKFAPYKWFNPEVVKFDISDFIPESWQIVYYD